MDVLGHQNISGSDKGIALPNAFELVLEDAIGAGRGQQRLPSITTEGKKVEDAAFLVSDKAPGHDRRILIRSRRGRVYRFPPCKRRRMGHPRCCQNLKGGAPGSARSSSQESKRETTG